MIDLGLFVSFVVKKTRIKIVILTILYFVIAGAWSEKIVPNMLAENAAILALGNKHGEINFWRYNSMDSQALIQNDS